MKPILNGFSDSLKLSFQLVCMKFYQKAFSECLRRFPLNEFLKNLRFVNPHVALNIASECDLGSVVDRIQCDKEECVRQFNLIRSYFNENEMNDFPKEILPFWMYLKNVRNFNDVFVFKSISELALTVLTLPHGNADVERIFSFLNDIKTKKRNRMSTSMLKVILTIKLDTFSKNKCCSEYVFNDRFYQKFNQYMYDHKNKPTDTSHMSE